MNQKNLMPQVAQIVNRITTREMPDVLAELEELDEKALSQVCGGQVIPPGVKGKPITRSGGPRYRR